MTVYTPEVYPVRIRGKGAALAMGWGRFGGMIAPIVAGFLIDGQNLFWVLYMPKRNGRRAWRSIS